MLKNMIPKGWLVFALAVAGCAPPVPSAGTQFDGRYAGEDRLVSGVAFQCGDQLLPEQIEVRGGRLDYPFQVNPPRTVPLPAQVGVDGSLLGQMQYGTEEDLPFQSRYRTDWVTLRGRIDGPMLDATISNMRCVRRLIAQRS